MTLTITETNYHNRDQKGKVAFYVLLWKREGITLELFDNYWKDVHGPVCARLPGQYQYWQFHVAHSESGLFPQIARLNYQFAAEDDFDGIAELTFESESDRQRWFEAAGILMDDEHNLFRKAIGYTTSPSNSITYVDGIPNGAPNGKVEAVKFHVMVKKASGVSVEAFRQYMRESFAPTVSGSDAVLKFRLHLFDDIDNSRPDAAGVIHSETPGQEYDGAFEIAFANQLEREKFFASAEYTTATKEAAKYIHQIRPFPERTVYTFVYDGKMTLAGERSAKVSELITSIGATNQLKEDISNLMLSGEYQNGQVYSSKSKSYEEVLLQPQPVKRTISQHLQGVQHFGITVNNLDLALEFYIDVLGGKLAIGGDGFIGEELHNLLFQKEDLEAAQKGISAKGMGVPNIIDGSQDALDVRFISFGNVCVELIHFRDAHLDSHAPNVFEAIPSGIGHVNSPHISFFVKDDVDLNEFATMLEEECHRRGMTKVVANRTIHLSSEEARAKAAHIYAKTEFPGDFDGWALFYCKGPNGEQLEFNQVRRTAKANFIRAQKEYNLANDNHYWGLNGRGFNESNKELVTNYSIPINASSELVWKILLDKIENPGNYMPSPVEYTRTLETYSDGMLREVKTSQMLVRERITIDEANKKITYDIVNYPMFQPRFINQVVQPNQPGKVSLPMLINIFQLTPLAEGALESEEAKPFLHAANPELIEKATLFLKDTIEKQSQPIESQGNTMTQAAYTQQTTVDTPGPKSAIVRQMFLAGESMNVENFVKFYTPDAHYQFSNFPVAYGPEGIKESSVGFLQMVAKVYHHITKMWEQGDTVICEMEVTYIRHDGKVFRLPCCDTIVFEGDKVKELRIYMDISPVFNTPQVGSEEVQPKGKLSAILGKMYEALHAENWEEFKTFFTDDVLYKIGANDPVIGPDAIAGLLQHIYKTLKLTTHNQRGFWEVGNTIILEMDANYVNKQNKTFVQVPCTDIYRFNGEKIFEWRVYPDASKTGVQL
jgi:ketosteroid isomerase-like protein